MKFNTAIFTFLILFTSHVIAQERIPADKLQEDFAILKQSLEELHPALYKYDDKEVREKDFKALKENLNQDLTQLEVYTHIAAFTAKIKCGHTYANYWNQNKEVRKHFIEAKNKLPFTFRIIDEKIYVHQNLSDESRLQSGDRILSIDGISAEKILSSLLAYVNSDGNNDGKRYFELQVFGHDTYNAFDIFYPLVFEVRESLTVKTVSYKSSQEASFNLKPLTRKERFQRLTKRFGKQIENYDDYWKFEIRDNKVGILTIGTFVTWKMSLNWRKFIKDAFTQMESKNIDKLILDIRGNGGGNSSVQEFLFGYLTDKAAQRGPFQQTLKSQAVSEELRPYIGTWNKGMMDVSNRTQQMPNGFYTFRKGGIINQQVKPKSKAFQGEVYVLADASNSSGTFFLLHYLKQNDLATIVGQESGGNMQGITGGQIFFLNLPNSGIEVDIPVIGYYPTEDRPNEGVKPDVEVKPSVNDLVKGIDSEMEKALELALK
ncbi:MAG: S41 family peptidase [Bacteroidota bacterium]